ncbi:hypothetical protein TNCV_3176411 [Trichonephila clavipes]|nr:hypothetical protein TNCV_3176411 [Trichonephila clavipes]
MRSIDCNGLEFTVIGQWTCVKLFFGVVNLALQSGSWMDASGSDTLNDCVQIDLVIESEGESIVSVTSFEIEDPVTWAVSIAVDLKRQVFQRIKVLENFDEKNPGIWRNTGIPEFRDPGAANPNLCRSKRSGASFEKKSS